MLTFDFAYTYNYFQMKRASLFILLLSLVSLATWSQQQPKREFRGAWVHVIGQSQYKDMSRAGMMQYFTRMLNEFQEDHINAVIFQVRPTADAFYYSEIEPWSRYFTGEQGLPPAEEFDPMAFMIEACHERNMEFHAWMNPYRVTAGKNDTLHDSHIYHQHPEWFVKYGNQLYFDPGIPACREYICRVVKDIVSRYDVDAIHMDDYFYPYPKPGEVFPDHQSFSVYGHSQGFRPDQRDDWRRNNVNLLIREIKETIMDVKPWVRFGISPFGIYRNKKDTPDGSGSATNGLQNYSDLYADVKLWVEKGWIDYNLPQVYWNIGNPPADYEVLIKWWSENNKGAHLYIGQDVGRTMKAPAAEKQLTRKMHLARTTEGVDGNCFWPGYLLMSNVGGVRDSLRTNYQRYPALIPAYTALHDKKPEEVKDLKAEWTILGYMLHWRRNTERYLPETAQYYVVYRFENHEKVNLDDPSRIVEITSNNWHILPFREGKEKYTYVVTAVDRFHNESKHGKSKSLKL